MRISTCTIRESMRAKAALFITAAGLAPAQAAAQPISYSRQIAPILAMNCHNCHGANPESAAGGLSTRTYADLKKGGNLGSVIVPGNPEQSALLQFVNGARGEAHRMPLGGPPLSGEQIALIRQWILEGAVEDSGAPVKYRLELSSVGLDSVKPVRISARVPTTGYVELELTGAGGRVLFMDGGAVKEVADVASIGTPDRW